MTNISRTILFWVAFTLTRPFGGTVGVFLEKPLDMAGLAISRYTAPFASTAVMVLLNLVLPQLSGKLPGLTDFF